MTALPTRLTVVFPNEKINPVLAGNSRSHWAVKAKARATAKDTAWELCLKALEKADTYASEFLTHDGRFDSPETILPLTVICRRYYSGRSKPMDIDNGLISFKSILDGVARALSCNDRDFKPVFEQHKMGTLHWLEVEIIPAWNGVTNPSPNQIMQKLGVI